MNLSQIDNYNLTRLQQEIEMMKQAIESYKRNVAKPHVIKKLSEECRVRIVNAATNLGDFATAYEYAESMEEARLLVRLARALKRGEADSCDCQPDQIQTQGSPVEVPRFFNWRRIYDQERAVWVDIYKCSCCEFMTANPNATCSQSARNLDRARASKINKKNPPKDHEVLKG